MDQGPSTSSPTVVINHSFIHKLQPNLPPQITKMSNCQTYKFFFYTVYWFLQLKIQYKEQNKLSKNISRSLQV